MTMMPIELCEKTDLASPMARVLQRIAMWHERRHQARAMRISLAEVPEHLRKDIGLDGGAPLHQEGQSGRTFITAGRPDTTLSDWRW
ncbi:hypothetical protein [Paracoccus sp. S1E-3]|uniref:hypothetical protein n=1 Tax=Paracoccus sp. S1E-3 TaxID=2756130 RepID=UPI0015EF93E4|nr:hypothetical protein [Paracoccus sp. S1E-3]MBA4490072.1 hypothetical protein [Paracoccus sp. S1E-3]